MSMFRNVVMGKAGGGSNPWDRYIQEGLVFQLDCDIECSVEKWTDIKGGYEFISNGNVTLNNGVPTFNEQAMYVLKEVLHHTHDDSTIEVVIKYNKNVGFVFFEGSHLGTAFIVRTNNKYVSGVNLTDLYNEWGDGTDKSNQVLSISIAGENSAYENNNKLTSKSKESVVPSINHTSIGGRVFGGTGMFNGKIYAIRIYNHLLTAEEMIHNQTIDLERFGDR